MARLYEKVRDRNGIIRKMSRSRDGSRWFGSIRYVNPDTGKEEPMAIEFPADAVEVVDADDKAA